MEIKIEKHTLPANEKSWQYFVVVSHGNNWEWVLLPQSTPMKDLETIKGIMKDRVLNTPQNHQFKKRAPWFDGYFVRFDAPPETRQPM